MAIWVELATELLLDRKSSKLLWDPPSYPIQFWLGSDGKNILDFDPNWLEWYMGWPIGWTALKPLGMDKFQKWKEQHGSY